MERSSLVGRTISVKEEWTHESKPLIDWIKLHGIDPNDCFEIEEDERGRVKFHLYATNPVTGKHVEYIKTMKAMIPLSEAGVL